VFVKIAVIVLLILAAQLVLGIVLGRFIAFGTREPRKRGQPPAADAEASPEGTDHAEPAAVETDTDRS
jgi:hypothetical protein